MVTGVISYGIGTTKTSIASWRLLFLVIGGFTLIWGVALTIWLPDSPLRDNFMKGRDKYIALDRVRENMTGIENKVSYPGSKIENYLYANESSTGVQMVSSPRGLHRLQNLPTLYFLPFHERPYW